MSETKKKSSVPFCIECGQKIRTGVSRDGMHGKCWAGMDESGLKIALELPMYDRRTGEYLYYPNA